MVRDNLLQDILIGWLPFEMDHKTYPDVMRVVSARFCVYNKEFARRFNIRKQAEAYMTASGFGRN